MSASRDNVIRTFPPRPISQWERAVLAEWFAAAKRKSLNVAQAYVSERRGDDPMIVGRIVIVESPRTEPSYLVYSPSGSTLWVVCSGPGWNRLQRFRTLRAGLNSIRPALDDPDASRGPEPDGDLIW